MLVEPCNHFGSSDILFQGHNPLQNSAPSFTEFRFSSVTVFKRKCFPLYKICRHDFGDCVRETPNAVIVSVTKNPSRHASMIWPH